MSATDDAIYIVDETDIALVLAVALHNPVRTVAQQEALLRLAALIDNPLVDWSHDATVSWEARRCSCGRAIPVLADNCSSCVREGVPA